VQSPGIFDVCVRAAGMPLRTGSRFAHHKEVIVAFDFFTGSVAILESRTPRT